MAPQSPCLRENEFLSGDACSFAAAQFKRRLIQGWLLPIHPMRLMSLIICGLSAAPSLATAKLIWLEQAIYKSQSTIPSRCHLRFVSWLKRSAPSASERLGTTGLLIAGIARALRVRWCKDVSLTPLPAKTACP